jgi:hypothetical protein
MADPFGTSIRDSTQSIKQNHGIFNSPLKIQSLDSKLDNWKAKVKQDNPQSVVAHPLSTAKSAERTLSKVTLQTATSN